ncbi:hypothetical protein RF11_02016 [Thelohanellus kitauei]|uniref:Uncharacterized protein n=1 Tax=Thelohanellus kitauei TaxID=669202 RepID=A0A0C2IRF2_THEKT|nr:hypothetical protein RF11_02016 [Thelohanellus kitauei]
MNRIPSKSCIPIPDLIPINNKYQDNFGAAFFSPKQINNSEKTQSSNEAKKIGKGCGNSPRVSKQKEWQLKKTPVIDINPLGSKTHEQNPISVTTHTKILEVNEVVEKDEFLNNSLLTNSFQPQQKGKACIK